MIFINNLNTMIGIINSRLFFRQEFMSELLKNIIYRTRAIISRSRFEAALVYKPRILSLKNEEFPFLVLT